METTAAVVGAAGRDVAAGVSEGKVGDEPQPATHDEPTSRAIEVQEQRIGRPFAECNRRSSRED
jgi:hypothetical protein